MFEMPVNVKAVSIMMRSPLSWGYYGINSAVLISEPGPVMLVSGVTSPSGEQCVVTNEDDSVSVVSCLSGIASGDGREVFSLDDDGQIKSVARDKCITLADGDTTSGGKFILKPCARATESGDGRSVFSLSANGQLKMPRMGNFCVTFMGDNVGFATSFDVAATSSQMGHSASSVADGDSTSFWASAYDPAENAMVDVQLKLGSPKQIHRVTIEWEYPATAFEVQVAKEGSWTTIYATSSNHLNHTTVFSSVLGEQIRVRMQEPHPVWGVVDGHSVYGIKHIEVAAAVLSMIVRDCVEAEDNIDARDKFFMVAVPEFDPAAIVSAQSSSKMLFAAQEHLGGLLAQVHAVLPTLENCELVQHSLGKLPGHIVASSLVRQQRSEHVQLSKKPSSDAVAVAVGQIEAALGLSESAFAALVAEAYRQRSKIR